MPKWTIDSIKILLTIVYFYSGLAKINSDWLFKAMPLKIWLPSKFDLPLIGENLMQTGVGSLSNELGGNVLRFVNTFFTFIQTHKNLCLSFSNLFSPFYKGPLSNRYVSLHYDNGVINFL